MDDNRIRIKFEFTNDMGNDYVSESYVEVFYDLGEQELDVIGRQLNAFLRQCGYMRRNDHIFMEDITEDEYDALSSYLEDLRNAEGN